MENLVVKYSLDAEFSPTVDDRCVSKEFFCIAKKVNEEFPDHHFSYEIEKGCAKEDGEVIFPKDSVINIVMDDTYQVIDYRAQNILTMREKGLEGSWALRDIKNCVEMTLGHPHLYKILDV